MIDIKYCKKCGEAFDIATNFDWCPFCRVYDDDDGEFKYEEIDDDDWKDSD